MRKIVLAWAACAAAMAASAAGPVDMKPGLWEISTRTVMAMEGAPPMPAQTTRVCVRPQDVEAERGALPVDKECKITSFERKASTVRWAMVCNKDGAEMRGSGEISYAGTSYSGKSQLEMKAEGEVMKMQSTYAAKRVGDCK